MQKLKKALKKLAGLKSKSSSSMAAKKAPPTKKKTQAVAAKKTGAAKKTSDKGATKKVVAKPAVKAKVAAKPSKADAKAKDLKKKAAAPAPKANGKAVKAAAPAPAKKAAAPAKEAKAPKTPPPAPVEAKAPKGKKAREEVVVEAPAEDEEVVLLDAEGRRYCRIKDCDQAAVVNGGYCRYHYLLFWNNIQARKKILTEGKLERYIEELTARYPDKYLDMLRKDMRSEKEFMAAIAELEIDEAAVDSEFEDEAQSYLDEVRGMGGGTEETSSRDDDF
ncbi:MAG TPA: hypothetical protein VM432_00755 [Bdellovibrionales bacterium]|nr:hypothetical protein [Bdellovibrionales bacterium]